MRTTGPQSSHRTRIEGMRLLLSRRQQPRFHLFQVAILPGREVAKAFSCVRDNAKVGLGRESNVFTEGICMPSCYRSSTNLVYPSP